MKTENIFVCTGRAIETDEGYQIRFDLGDELSKILTDKEVQVELEW